MGRSIFLFGKTGALAAGAQSGVLIPSDLRNPYGKKPIVIEELRFMTDAKIIPGIIAQPVGLGATAMPCSAAGQVYVALTLSGNTPLSNSIVPVWLYGYQLSRESNQNASQQDNYTWVLPRPMLLAPGESITPQFLLQPFPAVQAGTVHGWFAAVGREAEPEEAAAEEVYLPYCTSFVGAYQAGGAQYIEKSFPKDLLNPFDVPLAISGLSGRVSVYDSVNSLFYEAQQTYSHAAQTVKTMVQMFTQQGRVPVLKDYTPFGHVFTKSTRTWHARGTLPSKGGSLLVNLTEDLSLYASTLQFQVQIGLFGYRKVKRWWS